MGDSEVVRPYLRPGEQLLWCGHPDPAVLFTAADLYLIPLSLLWTAFSLFWESSVISDGAPWPFKLWGVPFVLFGLYFIVGRFFAKRWRKERTSYGVTTDRAIVVVGRTSLSDVPLRQQLVHARRSRDGQHASVIIGHSLPAWPRSASNYANTGLDLLARGYGLPFGLWDVADGPAMLQAIDHARLA